MSDMMVLTSIILTDYFFVYKLNSVFLEGTSSRQRIVLRRTRRVVDLWVDKLRHRVVVVGQFDECGIACTIVSKGIFVFR